jgi:hypothetical protein
MPDDRIQQLLGRIQRLRSEQVQAIQDAVYLGMTPRVARECEYRRELIAALVDRLAAVHRRRSLSASPHCAEPSPAHEKSHPQRAA